MGSTNEFDTFILPLGRTFMNISSMAITTQQATSELEPWLDLKGMVVMVTGASSGIGREFCIDLAKSGCRIIAAARRTDRLKSLCDEINNVHTSNGHVNHNEARKVNNGVIAVAVELDVSADGPAIEDSVRKAWSAFGHIDALINNAGIRGPYRSLLDLKEEDWDRTFGTNVKGSWLVSKYVCQQMLASNQEGSIINISSIAGLNRLLPHGAVAYASSKSALNTMTKVM
ncbi:putative 3-oxoacyl-[acyl-carrier-protein] reductase [Helianthus anomalus]